MIFLYAAGVIVWALCLSDRYVRSAAGNGLSPVLCDLSGTVAAMLWPVNLVLTVLYWARRT